MSIVSVSGQFNSDADRAALLAAVPAAVVVAETIDQAQARQTLRIMARRDLLTSSGGYRVNVSGVDKWFHSDLISRSQQLGLVLLGANISAGLQWKTMDKSFVTMTQTLATQIFAAAVASDTAIFAAAETIKTGMLNSADPANYDITTGWPVTYLGSVPW